jgi:hypothetical protein
MSNPLESWTEEQRSAYLYRACAEAEAGTPRADLFTQLAGEAEAQAAIWRAQLTASGKPAPKPFVPELRTRLVARLVALLGPRPLRAILAAMKVRGMVIYSGREPGGHVSAAVGGIERRHRGLSGGGNLRAQYSASTTAWFQCETSGVAGASSDAAVVLLTVWPASPPAYSRWPPANSSRCAAARALRVSDRLERDELKEYPEAEAQELARAERGRSQPRRQAAYSTRSTHWTRLRAKSSASIRRIGLTVGRGGIIAALLAAGEGAAAALRLRAGALPISALLTGLALASAPRCRCSSDAAPSSPARA